MVFFFFSGYHWYPNNKCSREKSPLFSSAFVVGTEMHACKATEDDTMGR